MSAFFSFKKRFLLRAIASLTLILCLPHMPFSSRAVTPPDELSLSAASAVLYEPMTGQFLYEKDADKRRPMASTTKIMTALVAIENASLSDTITVAPEAVGVEGSSIYLTAGEKVTLEVLLYALLLQSANDAATAIAYGLAGSVQAFADMMNERAKSMGLQDTHFTNPHGLHDDSHYTTARELAIIAGEAMKNETFRAISSTVKKTITLQDGTVSRVLVNHNRMLRMYDDIIGVKTGFTKKSGRCLVGAAEKVGLLLISVTLSAPNDWQDHRNLLDYGFLHYVCKNIVDAGAYRATLPVIGGKKTHVTVQNAEPLRACLPTEATYTIHIELARRPLSAPLQSGEHVGTLFAKSNGKVVGSTPLIVTEEVPKNKLKKGLFGKLFAD